MHGLNGLENIFPIVASNIELMCNFDNGSVRYWDGFGAKKRIGFEQSAENWKMMMEMDDSIGEMESGFMEYQVYIGPIWTDISPYLES